MNWEGLNPPYRTIVADPPWPYAGSGPVGAGGRGREYALSVRRPSPSASERYSLLSIADLCQLPVSDLVGEDAHLYLWTTNAFVAEAHQVASAWGFVPKTILTWVKVDANGKPSMKTGYYFRGATEHAVFAVRGSLRLRTDAALPTAYLWPRIGRHSVKPGAFGDLVEQASPGPYVELFARQPRFGWDSWGHGYEELGA